MYNKTTSPYFIKYGKISESFKRNKSLKKQIVCINDKHFDSLSKFSVDVYIEVISGMPNIAISTTNDVNDIELFVIHSDIRINKNTYFNIFPLTDETSFYLYTPENFEIDLLPLDRPFHFNRLTPKVYINEIYAYYYSVKGPGYNFKGETHQYFEITFVDNGSLKTDVNNETFVLDSYDLLIYGPGQFHDQVIQSSEPCSYLTIIFSLSCIAPEVLLNRIFHISKEHYAILQKFVQQTTSNHPYSKDLMINYLQELIIHLLQYDIESVELKPSTPFHQHFENELLEEILTYINNHIYEPLPIDEICYQFSISRSSLQKLFKDYLKMSPKLYINEVKLAKSLVLIKKAEYTISEIANMLGFNSIHYFSRKFSQRYELTPSEYAKKIYSNDNDN